MAKIQFSDGGHYRGVPLYTINSANVLQLLFGLTQVLAFFPWLPGLQIWQGDRAIGKVSSEIKNYIYFFQLKIKVSFKIN